jgi:hypothetical protein
MNRISNQDIEKHYFEKFCKDYPLPPGTIIHDDSPDVTVEGERLIGIEITNFFLRKGSLPESEQIQSKLRKKVVSEAQRIYQTENRKKIEISFGFDEANPIREQKKLVRKLVDLAKQIGKRETGKIRKDLFKAVPELSFAYLNAEEYKDAEWRVYQVHDVPIMSRDRLVDIVRDKEIRARKYKKCDAYWLLVIVDSFNPAQDQKIQINGFEKMQTEVFEKVIIYQTPFGHVHELETK